MKIGILQTGYVPEELSAEHGDYPQMFKKLLNEEDFEFESFAIVDNIFPKSIDECDAWLVTGSKHGAYEDHVWIPPLEDLIRKIYAANIPLVGICFGHQIMAQALGGKVAKFGGLWGVGAQEYSHPDGTKTRLLAMHQDQVVEKPEEAEVIATNDFCQFAGLAYKKRALSFQPHPEFTPHFMEQLIKARAGTAIPMEQATPALQDVLAANDASLYAKKIASFLKGA